MPQLLPREIIPFPSGVNSTTTIVGGYNLNKTTLDFWNYTLFSNNTISNGSDCVLAVPNLRLPPILLSNGTFINATSCYFPYWGVGERGIIGIMFGALFGFSLMFTFVALRKHGTLYLPQEKKFRAVGRRWQYYWASFVAACGAISAISAIDVDRNYLQSSGILIQSLFWYLMIPGLLATIWEGARHWLVFDFKFEDHTERRSRGSWQERQLYDIEPFSMHDGDRRSKVEFWLPLIFYLFAWLA